MNMAGKFMDVNLVFFSTRSNSEYIPIPKHNHSCYELVYYIKGTGSTTIGKKENIYTNNTFILVEPNTYHTETPTADTELVYFGFEVSNPSIQIREGFYKDNFNKDILKIILQMKDEDSNKDSNYISMIDIYISQIIITLDRIINPKKIDWSPSFSHVINFINENYHEKIDIEQLAEMSCLSYHRFRHLFKEVTGFSAIQYILFTRFKNAKSLLENTEDSITSIAYSCGFSNTAQFSNLFKKNFTLSPKDYRNKHQQF